MPFRDKRVDLSLVGSAMVEISHQGEGYRIHTSRELWRKAVAEERTEKGYYEWVEDHEEQR